MNSHKRALFTLLLLMSLITACTRDTLAWAREQVNPGMERKEAIEILSKQSWYHQTCPNLKSIDDLFFFGDHSYEEAEIIILNSIEKDSVYRVSDIGTLETNAWHAAYQDCLQKERFTK